MKLKEFGPPGRGAHLSRPPLDPPLTPWEDTPLGRHPRGQTSPLGRHPPPEIATAADGTHPTGMHSCQIIKTRPSYHVSFEASLFLIQRVVLLESQTVGGC